ncbi:MAG: SLBB domain-containing protein, partial [Nitrospiraceae bacterium]|nr:SLBB domain-containing protein [Nitrospiraceae bacterium]
MRQLVPRHFLGLLGVGAILAVAFLGCHNPASSSLPPSAISAPGTAIPPLPRGDVYADETVPTAETPIETGDTLEVVIRRGAGEEKFASVVRENGKVSVGFMEVDVGGITAALAEIRVQEAAVPYMHEPRVQVLLKKKVLKVKRVFVFGDVKKPGMVPMSRHMTVLQAIAAVDTYQETALMEEVRVIRGGDLSKPTMLMADLARAFTYGDMTRNLALEENDIVFVPREHLGDASEAGKKIMPIISAGIAPLFPVFLI